MIRPPSGREGQPPELQRAQGVLEGEERRQRPSHSHHEELQGGPPADDLES